MDNLKTYENLIGDIDKDLLESVESLQKAKMIDAMSPYSIYKEIPQELNYILIELTIYRFNRIGSEGMESESKTAGTESYDKDYEDKLLDKCIDFAKNETLYDGKWNVKLLWDLTLRQFL